jgi:predicted DNA-binding transcriptional regulator YafY
VRADRLVSLVLLLQARGRMTAADLAVELSVSIRTVYRDMEALNAAGVPVYAESGPHGGCRLLEGYRFPLRGLRPEEAEALLILGVPTVLRDLGLDGASPVGSQAFVHLDMPPWFRSEEPALQLRVLAEALRQQRRLELRYAREPDRAQGASLRTVAPLGLVNKAGIWYLVASPSTGRITVFRCGRIVSARVLAGRAERPAGFELAAFWAGWSAEFEASRPRLPVTLRASPLALAILPEVFGDQVRGTLSAAGEPAADGWRELTLSFEHELAAAQRLAGFGADIEVISPAAVRDRLVHTARGILSRY